MTPKTTKMIVEEEEEDTQDNHGCFSWFLKLFRRKKRGRRLSKENSNKCVMPLCSDTHTVDDNEENEKDGFQTDENVRFHFPYAESKEEKPKDAKPSLTPSPIVTTPMEDDKHIKINIEVEKQEENENDGFQTDENVCFHFPAAEINEAKVEREKGTVATAEDVGEARQAELGNAEEEQQPEVVKTWAEEVDEAEEKGLDVFAPLAGCLPHTAAFVCQTAASHESEAGAASATTTTASATQRRRERRRTLSEALKVSAQSEVSSVASEVALLENEAPAAVATSVKISATHRRRARRIALSAALKVSAESRASTSEEGRPSEESKTETSQPADSTEQPQAPVRTPFMHVGAHGSDEHPMVSEATVAAANHIGTNRTRRRNAQRKALATRVKSETRLAATTQASTVPDGTPFRPSPSVRVFGSDGRPLITTWEQAAYGAFHARRKY